MSENIPESVPTSSDRRSQRPVKKRALDPLSKQSESIEALFANPAKHMISTEPRARHLAAPPEIVANVQGSSAGAGSGEFHVYKASRRREYERLRAMDEEKDKEEADAEFEKQRDETRKKDDERTSKNRARRDKAKQRKGKPTGTGVMDHDRKGEKTGVAAGRLQPHIPTGRASAKGQGIAGAEGDADIGKHEEIGIVIHDDD